MKAWSTMSSLRTEFSSEKIPTSQQRPQNFGLNKLKTTVVHTPLLPLALISVTIINKIHVRFHIVAQEKLSRNTNTSSRSKIFSVVCTPRKTTRSKLRGSILRFITGLRYFGTSRKKNSLKEED
jgi:hypothetical protein